MLSKCLNSLCSARFRRLGNGRLFRIDFSEAAKRNPMLGAAPNYVQPTHAMEHFWLCGKCAATLTVVLNKNGEVRVVELPPKMPAASVLTPSQSQQTMTAVY